MAEAPDHTATQSLILFDLDGTLTNPKLGITSGVHHALEKLGIEAPSADELEFFIGPPMRLMFKQTYGLAEQEVDQAVEYYREYYDPIGWRQNEVYEGIPEALKALGTAGFKLGLATSKPTVFAQRILDHFGLRDEFSVLAGSNLDGTREDKAEVIRYALAEAGFDIGSDSSDVLVEPQVVNRAAFPVTMVGDRKYDIIGAKRLGLRSVGVTYGFGSREELESAGADVIIDRPNQLVEALLPAHQADDR